MKNELLNFVCVKLFFEHSTIAGVQNIIEQNLPPANRLCFQKHWLVCLSVSNDTRKVMNGLQ